MELSSVRFRATVPEEAVESLTTVEPWRIWMRVAASEVQVRVTLHVVLPAARTQGLGEALMSSAGVSGSSVGGASSSSSRISTVTSVTSIWW